MRIDDSFKDSVDTERTKLQPYLHQWRSSSTLLYKPQQPTIPLFALTKG